MLGSKNRADTTNATNSATSCTLMLRFSLALKVLKAFPPHQKKGVHYSPAPQEKWGQVSNLLEARLYL